MKTISHATHIACIGLLAGTVALTHAPFAHAQNEALYVIEQLIIAVSAAPDGTGERVASIRSGDRVEVLERQGEYIRVKVRSGAEGWVKGSYLSPEPPLRERLDEQTKALEAARAQITRLKSELADTRVAAAPEAPASIPSDPSLSITAAPAAASPANDGTSEAPMLSLRSQAFSAIWPWTVGSATLALIAGFVLGWRMLDRRIRRKYGGLRIY